MLEKQRNMSDNDNYGTRYSNHEYFSANFSDIMDVSQGANVSIKMGEDEISWEEMADGKDLNACLRLEIHLVNISTALVYLTVIPLSLDEMKEVAERWEVDIHSDRWPMAILPVGIGQPAKKPVKSSLMVMEKAGTGCGLGLFPLIEQVIKFAMHGSIVIFKLSLSMLLTIYVYSVSTKE